MLLSALAVAAILVGSAVELVPMLLMSDRDNLTAENLRVKPLTPLALTGRDIYIREGCYTCHSQMIRKMVPDVIRYGKESTIADSLNDHPFQWGSKRTGPDLARVGGKYPDTWHLRHMINPRDIVPQSIMPEYAWLAKQRLDTSHIAKKLRALKTLGVPYTDLDIQSAEVNMLDEAKQIGASLKEQGGGDGLENKEIVAMIAYLQSLGKQVEEIKKVSAR